MRVLYGALPREAVCTENLTPWLKLLPCRDVDGLGALLNRPQVYSAAYHSMHTHLQVNTTGAGASRPSLTLTQSLTLVLRPPGSQQWVADPHNVQPCDLLRSLFEFQPNGPCPLASTSNVYLGVPSLFSPKDLSEVKMFRFGDPSCQWASTEELLQRSWTPLQPPQLKAQLHVALEDGQSGTLVTQVQLGHGDSMANGTRRDVNHGSSVDSRKTICISQLVPWYLRVHLHTLQLTINHRAANWQTVAKNYSIVPSKDRQKPTVIEICVPISGQSSHLSLSVRFDKGFLTVFEHPPDTARSASFGCFQIVSASLMVAFMSMSPSYELDKMLFLAVYIGSLMVTGPNPVPLYPRGFDVPAAIAQLRSGAVEFITCPLLASSDAPLVEHMQKASWRQVLPLSLLCGSALFPHISLH